MGNRTNIAAKVILLALSIFAPYYVWIIAKGLSHTLPSYPWPAVIGLGYFACGISIVVFVARRMFRRALLDDAVSSDVDKRKSSSLAIAEIYISSVDHLRLFRSLPWYARWLGILPTGFPRVRTVFYGYPALYFATGSLSVDQGVFAISAHTVSSGQRGPYKDLAPQFRLTVTPNEITSIQRFDMREIVKTDTPLPFLRIQTTSGVVRDLLVCSASRDIEAMRQETENLWFALGRLMDRRTSAYV